MATTRFISALGLGLLALTLVACGGSSSDNSGGGGTTSPLAKAAATVKVENDPVTTGKYVPSAVTVKVGDTVEWDFNDDQGGPHTVTSDDTTSFDSQAKGVTGNKGDKFQFTFTKVGTFPYHCTFHANMHGSVTAQ